MSVIALVAIVPSVKPRQTEAGSKSFDFSDQSCDPELPLVARVGGRMLVRMARTGPTMNPAQANRASRPTIAIPTLVLIWTVLRSASLMAIRPKITGTNAKMIVIAMSGPPGARLNAKSI